MAYVLIVGHGPPDRDTSSDLNWRRAEGLHLLLSWFVLFLGRVSLP